jgi:RNA polymerase sigma-70 factor (ECF subfamily)
MAGSSKVIQIADAKKGAGARVTPAIAEERGEHDDAVLVQKLGEGDPRAERVLLERYGVHVERILMRILGASSDLDDLTQEVFVRAFDRLDELHEPAGLRRWLTAIAVFVAREAIRKRRRRRWLVFRGPEEMPEVSIPEASMEARAAFRAFYAVVRSMQPDQRIAFTLR